MSDEAAFLAALKANPADDTARLVYADWLDEHEEPQKAEYLRLVVRLPEHGDDIDVTSAEAIRANELGQRLLVEWSETAAGRFDLVLLGINEGVMTVKRIREVFGVGLGEAKRIVEASPNRLLSRMPFEAASRYFTRFATTPYMALVVRRSDIARSQSVTLFKVVADFHLPPYYSGPSRNTEYLGDDPARDKQAHESLARLVAGGLEISLDEARLQAAKRPVVLGNELSHLAAERFVERCRRYFTNEMRYSTECHVASEIRTTT